MNRLWLAVVSILIVVLALALVLYVTQQQAQPPQDAQTKAATYARYLSGTTGQFVVVQHSVRAAHPERFVQTMSQATYGDNGHFSTTFSLTESIAQGQLKSSANAGMPQLPYPPDELWCVRLSNGAVIAAGLHRTLYFADWVLHEINDQATTMATIGCALR